MNKYPHNRPTCTNQPYNDGAEINYSNNFRNVYNNVNYAFPHNLHSDIIRSDPLLPSILNFDFNKDYRTNSRGPTPKTMTHHNNQSYFENDPVLHHSSTTRKTEPAKQNNPQEKCGIKTLLNTKSKMIYPFDKVEQSLPHTQTLSKSTSVAHKPDTVPKISSPCKPMETIKPVVPPPIVKKGEDETQLHNFIEKEVLSIKENFIVEQPAETKAIINVEKEIADSCLPKIDLLTSINCIAKEETPAATTENLSDIENRMTNRTKSKKIDNKNHDISIVNMEDKQDKNRKMDDNKDKPVATETKPVPEVKPDQPAQTETIEPETKKPESSTTFGKKETNPITGEITFNWPALSLDNINTTFKVVGNLKEGIKLKVVENKYLSEDNAIVAAVARYTAGEGRDKIISFLDHLFLETKRNIDSLLIDIRSGVDVDTNVSDLENTIGNMMIFLHRYEVMRNVYVKDTGVHAKMGVTRNKFFNYRSALFRNMVIPK